MRNAIGLITGLCVAAAACADVEKPGAFTDLTLHEALERSRESGRLLAVHATAVWCGPCKMMERDTWSNDEVIAWVREHGLVISVDVDERKEEAAELGVRAMPTIVLYRDGEEFERAVGYQGPAEMLAWLDGAREGKTRLDALIALHGDRVGPDGRVDVGALLSMAGEMAAAGRHEEALEEIVWVWGHMGESMPQTERIRGSMVTLHAAPLIEAHEPAAAWFRAARDEAEASLRAGEGGDGDLADWIAINRALGEDERTLAWIDRVKGTPEGHETLGWFLSQVQSLLVREERWADLGAIHPDPVFSVRRSVGMLQMDAMMELAEREAPADAEEVIAAASELHSKRGAHVIRSGADIYIACLAAGRDDEAGQIAEILVATFGAGPVGVELVSAAQRAGEAREEHRSMLEAAAAEGADGARVSALKAWLEDALR